MRFTATTILEHGGIEMKNECRKGTRRKSALLLVAMLILMSLLTACDNVSETNSYYHLDVVEHTSDFYVNDFAGVFSEAQKNELMAKAVALDEEYSGIQVVITTIKSVDETVLGYEYVVEDADGNRVEDAEAKDTSSNRKFTIEQVAHSMYSQYGIGQDDMGILILFSTGDREVRIATGRQMQFYITDTMSGRLLDDYGMEYFSDDKFAEGLISVQSAVIDEIKERVSADWYTASQVTQTDSQKSEVADVDNVTGEATEVSDESVVAMEKTEEKNSGNGILWGSIATAFAAIVAFIRQKFKGKKEKENFEKAKQEEVEALQVNFQSELAERNRIHEANTASLTRDYQRLIEEKEAQIGELRDEVGDAQREIGTLKKQLEIITDKYDRIQRLHPEYNFDVEVHEMIEAEYQATARELDANLAQVLAISADKDNYDVFNRALILFDAAKPEVKKYVTSDRAAIQNRYDEAVWLKQEFERVEKEKRDKAAATKAYDEIKRIYEDNPQGNYQTYSALHSALAIFLGLSVAEKAFFPDNNLIEELKRIHHSAEADHNDYEAAHAAESNVMSIIGRMSSADEDDRDKLERAMRYYRNLTSAQQAYFSDELYRKLKRLIDEAEEDHRRQERKRDAAAAARRARQRSSSSFSSSSRSSRSSFSGRGGRPSGGGATRRF